MAESSKDQGGVELIPLASLLVEDDRNPIGIIEPPKEEVMKEEEKIEDPTEEGISLENFNNDSSLKDEKNIAEDSNEDGEKKVSEKQETTTEVSEQYRQTLKSVFGINKITIEDEDGNEVEKTIDEMDVDMETFQELVEKELAYRKEEANKNKISIEGISERTKKLIEIEQKGGDIMKLLKIEETYSEPLSGLDLTTQQGQVDAIYLRRKATGLSDKEINILIKGYVAEGILEEEALQAQSELKAIIDQEYEKEKERTEKELIKREEHLKRFKKDFRDKLSEKFTLNDNMTNKLVTTLTKKSDDGKYYLDDAYLEAMGNPETATELVLFLTDREEFLKQITAKAVHKNQLETAKKLKIVRSSHGGTSTTDSYKKEKVISLDNL